MGGNKEPDVGDRKESTEGAQRLKQSDPVKTPIVSAEDPVGRIKEPPVCVEASLRAVAMNTQELSLLAYNTAPSPPEGAAVAGPRSEMNEKDNIILDEKLCMPPPPDAVPVSSSSSICTRESDSSDAEGKSERHPDRPHVVATTAASGDRCVESPSVAPSPTIISPDGCSLARLELSVAERLNAKIAVQKTSRQGRSSQRWVHDATSNESIRLVTGCVPVLRTGKILFVSSSRKAEWILPKGGWELDEEIEESAVRESYEEAGVLGILGPKLRVVQYETRKAKKRRSEREELERQKKTKPELSEGEVKEKTSTIDDKKELHPAVDMSEKRDADSSALETCAEVVPRVRCETQESTSSSSSQKSSPETVSNYSQVRMSLFPLYVTSVFDSWPESGRFRKAVEIDEAIRMLESRPEFKAAVLEVKQRGLHLIQDPRNMPLEASRTTTASS